MNGVNVAVASRINLRFDQGMVCILLNANFSPRVSVKDYCHGRGARLETGTRESFRLDVI